MEVAISLDATYGPHRDASTRVQRLRMDVFVPHLTRNRRQWPDDAAAAGHAVSLAAAFPGSNPGQRAYRPRRLNAGASLLETHQRATGTPACGLGSPRFADVVLVPSNSAWRRAATFSRTTRQAVTGWPPVWGSPISSCPSRKISTMSLGELSEMRSGSVSRTSASPYPRRYKAGAPVEAARVRRRFLPSARPWVGSS